MEYLQWLAVVPGLFALWGLCLIVHALVAMRRWHDIAAQIAMLVAIQGAAIFVVGSALASVIWFAFRAA